VINKPAGLLSIPDRMQSEPSLKDKLLEKYGNIYTVHRLDKGTSGVIVFARNEDTHKHLSQQFEERSTRKIYAGLVIGQPAIPKGVIDEPITEHFAGKGVMMTDAKGKPAITEYEVAESFRSYSWMQFHILTGPDDARQMVNQWADQGFTSFKAYMYITRAELGAATEAAHKRGIKVTGHLCAVGFREAAALGIDNLEHGIVVDTEFVPDKKADVCPAQAATFTAASCSRS